MGRIAGRALVLGGSIAGVTAARVLADRYDRVTIVDRDELSDVSGHRRGVPQGRHVHVLLPRGKRAIGELFPGFYGDLVAEGASLGSTMDATLCFSGQRMCRVDAGLDVVRSSRLLLEDTLRERVLALPNVEVLGGRQVAGLTSDDGRAVSGVRVLDRASGEEETFAADLVVDATGRGSQAASWLEELGYPTPEVEEVRADVTYTTMQYPHRPGDEVDEIIAGPEPSAKRAGGAVVIEGDRWLVMMAGVLGERPPTDHQGFVDYAGTLAIPDIHELIRDRRPLTDAVVMRYPANRRSHYEQLDRFPEGLVVTGDALCSLNPIYAQGMSMAAVEAIVLGECLDEGTDRIGPRFFEAVEGDVDVAWTMARSNDVRRAADGAPPSLKDRLLGSYLDRVTRAASSDPVVTAAFLRVVTMVAPPQTLLHPRVVLRVAADSLRRRVRPVTGDRGVRAPTATT